MFLAFTFSFPCNQTSLRQAKLVSWTKGFGCTGVIGNDVVLMLQQAIDRRKVRLRERQRTSMKMILFEFLGSKN